MDLAQLEQEYLASIEGTDQKPFLLPESVVGPTDAAVPVSVWKEASLTSVNHVDLRAQLALPEMNTLSVGSPLRKPSVGLNIAAPSDDVRGTSVGVSSPIVGTSLPERPPKFAIPEVGFTQWEPGM